MNTTIHAVVATGLIALFTYSTTIHAALPEACFKSKSDYAIYLKYGEQGPSYPEDIDWGKATAAEKERYEAQLEDYEYGPAERATITIRVKQTQASPGARILADASASTTPSGKKTFVWESSDIISETAEYSSSGGSPGSYSHINLTVTDPVCEVSQSTQVRITSK